MDKQTIPRLELLSNLTASRMVKNVNQALENVVKVNDVVNWTDSMISLWWIRNTDKNTSSLWRIGWRNQTKFATCSMELLSYVRTETLISLLPSWEMLNRNMLVNINIKSKNSELFSFHLLFYSFRC